MMKIISANIAASRFNIAVVAGTNISRFPNIKGDG